MKTTIFLILISMLSLTNCDKKNQQENKEIKHSLIAKGNLNGSESIAKSNKVITDIDSWEKLTKKINSINKVTDTFTETNIDFNKYQVIAVFDKVYPNGGHSIDIINIIEHKNNIVVTVKNLLKGNDATVLSQPFYIVKINKNNKLIIFQ